MPSLFGLENAVLEKSDYKKTRPGNIIRVVPLDETRECCAQVSAHSLQGRGSTCSTWSSSISVTTGRSWCTPGRFSIGGTAAWRTTTSFIRANPPTLTRNLLQYMRPFLEFRERSRRLPEQLWFCWNCVQIRNRWLQGFSPWTGDRSLIKENKYRVTQKNGDKPF